MTTSETQGDGKSRIRLMKMIARGPLRLILVLWTIVGSVRGDDFPMSNNSDWNIHAEPTTESKRIGAPPFDEQLIFRKGVLTTPDLQEIGFASATYHLGGIETFAAWSCGQKNGNGETVAWEGIADLQHPGAWKIRGTMIRSFPNGRRWKYRFYGDGKPTWDPLETR